MAPPKQNEGNCVPRDEAAGQVEPESGEWTGSIEMRGKYESPVMIMTVTRHTAAVDIPTLERMVALVEPSRNCLGGSLLFKRLYAMINIGKQAYRTM